jgi:hypothetical protein
MVAGVGGAAALVRPLYPGQLGQAGHEGEVWLLQVVTMKTSVITR